MNFFFLMFCVLWLFLQTIVGLRCEMGWGQRGMKHSDGIVWPRECSGSGYCFEAVTRDISIVSKLIDYPWDPYYYQYYVKGCGGSFGTPLQIHPFKGNPKYFRTIVGSVKLNISTPLIVTGHGGKELFDLNYECRRNMCSGLSLI